MVPKLCFGKHITLWSKSFYNNSLYNIQLVYVTISFLLTLKRQIETETPLRFAQLVLFGTKYIPMVQDSVYRLYFKTAVIFKYMNSNWFSYSGHLFMPVETYGKTRVTTAWKVTRRLFTGDRDITDPEGTAPRQWPQPSETDQQGQAGHQMS